MLDDRKLRVLIVDDNTDSAEILAVLVGSWGYATAVAGTGAEAVKTAAVFRPTVVLLDLSLPDQHGYQVARQLRESAQRRKIYFVAITGWSQIADQLQSTAAGIAHHLVKPVNPRVLEKILAAHQEAEDLREPDG